MKSTAYGHRSGQIVASEPVASGNAHIVVSVEPKKPDSPSTVPANLTTLGRLFGIGAPAAGSGTLTINGQQVGQAEFLNVVAAATSETLDIGSDLSSAVSSEYKSPNRFAGSIDRVVIEIR